MIERINILCQIITIKSEVWTITHCLGLGHETMLCTVCLFVFLFLCVRTMYKNQQNSLISVIGSDITVLQFGTSQLYNHIGREAPSTNTLALGRCGYNTKSVIFVIKVKFMENFSWNCSRVNTTRPDRCFANIGSGNWLMPSSNKPLSELINADTGTIYEVEPLAIIPISHTVRGGRRH